MSAPAEPVAAHRRQMDEIYRRQRHIYDMTRKYYLLGRDQAIRDLAVPRDGAVLEVGCGTARNLVSIARCYPRSAVYGVDISRQMLATAAAGIARARLGARVFLAHGDAVSFDAKTTFGRESFDRVLFSYTLSMIPDWRTAIRHAASVLAPGGAIRIVDFGDQSDLPAWLRSGLRAWLARFDVTPRDDLAQCLNDVAREFALACEVRSSPRRYAVHGTLMG